MLLTPHVSEEMLDPEFWIDRIADADRILAAPERIRAYGDRIIAAVPSIRPVHSLPATLSRPELISAIQALSVQPEAQRYDREGRTIPDTQWSEWQRNLALDTIAGQTPVRFGLVTRRAAMRTFPTDTAILKAPGQYDLDRFMETAVYPGEPVAVLWTSRDARWHFTQVYNYAAWIPADHVAFLERRGQIMPFAVPPNTEKDDHSDSRGSLVVTARRIATAFSPSRPEVSELTLDMGTRLPLVPDSEIPTEIDGQSTSQNHVVWLPTRIEADGSCRFVPALIPYQRDSVSRGFLPLTRANVIRQAFKCLGERYGWGGMYHARDCASLIADIFRCFGLYLPRNAGQQGKMLLNPQIHPTKSVVDLDQTPPGAALYLEGHVMLYLGVLNGRHYAIHDLYEYYVPDDSTPASSDGSEVSLRPAKANQVMVTDLSLFRRSGETLLESLYAVRDLGLCEE